MWLPFRRPSPTREGFWFDHPDKSIALNRDGERVNLAHAAPPWLVVDQSLSSISIGSHWPGRLWRVQVKKLGDMSGLVAEPGYWRATAIELLEEMPLSALFGSNGVAVVNLLTQIRTLSRAQAEDLSKNVHENASAAYNRAWIRWSETRKHPRQTQDEDDWRGVLAAPSRHDKERSPINSGFLLVHSLMSQRALELDGDNAFTLVEVDGSTEQILTPVWQNACDSFLFAAMALGAPEYVSAADSLELTRAWGSVYRSGSESGNGITSP